MPVKLGGATGGAGDTYTASTAVAGIPVESGKLYTLDNAGKLAPSTMEIESSGPYGGGDSAVTDAGSYNNQCGVYGDMITPDGKASFHLVVHTGGSGHPGIFYISLDKGATENGPVMNSSTGAPFSDNIGYGGAKASVHLKLIGEETDYWFYVMVVQFQESGGFRILGRGFMVRKDNHKFHTTGSTYHDGNQAPIWLAEQNMPNNYRLDLEAGRQGKMFFNTCRSGDIFVWTNPNPGGSTESNGVVLSAIDTYRSSTSSYWGGTNTGLPKTSGHEYGAVTHRDNAEIDTHQPLFKVDDANGIFIAPYMCDNGTNDGEYVFLKYTVAADHTITTSSEVLITGTDPTWGTFGHWIATTNPLIYWYTYLTGASVNGDRLSYIKCTFNADWTAAAWSGEAYLTPSVLQGGDGFNNEWGHHDPVNAEIHTLVKHSVPEKELLFVTAANSAADNALTFSFPASGTPSELGVNKLNNTLGGVYGNKMVMQSMNSGAMMSISHPWVSGGTYDRGEQGYAIYYTDYFNPNFKKTADLVAIARADGAVGATVAIDLKSGDTASATLSSDYYATKEGMSYPLDVEGGASAAFTTAIKSIQRGVYGLYATSATTTISTVDVDKSFVSSSTSSASGADEDAYVQLSDATTLTFVRNSNSGTSDISWEVIEFV